MPTSRHFTNIYATQTAITYSRSARADSTEISGKSSALDSATVFVDAYVPYGTSDTSVTAIQQCLVWSDRHLVHGHDITLQTGYLFHVFAVRRLDHDALVTLLLTMRLAEHTVHSCQVRQRVGCPTVWMTHPVERHQSRTPISCAPLQLTENVRAVGAVPQPSWDALLEAVAGWIPHQTRIQGICRSRKSLGRSRTSLLADPSSRSRGPDESSSWLRSVR